MLDSSYTQTTTTTKKNMTIPWHKVVKNGSFFAFFGDDLRVQFSKVEKRAEKGKLRMKKVTCM